MLKIIKTYRKYRSEARKSAPYPVKFFNFWPHNLPDLWFFRFVQSRRMLENFPDLTLSFFSVFGEPRIMTWDRSPIKIFFNGENLRLGKWSKYSDHGLSSGMDLALGFDHLDQDRYLRFPLWLLYLFAPESGKEDIEKRCRELTFPEIGERPEFASLISRYDKLGIRGEMFRALSSIGSVACAGVLLNNTDDLKRNYGDSKHNYLKKFKFNICPENSDQHGYVTEKVFEAIDSGCVPIYWGSNNRPEPEILNPDAILFWNREGDNSELLERIKALNASPKLFDEMASLPRLKPGAAEIVLDQFQELERRLNALIHEKGGRGTVPKR